MANPKCSICKGEGVFYEHSTVETCWCSLSSQSKAERDVLAELEACRKDAERYRHLRKLVYASNPRGEGSWSFHYEGFPRPISNPCRGETRSNWDAAIDASMSQEANHA